MPTSRRRYTLTETDELAAALEQAVARFRGPGTDLTVGPLGGVH